MPGYKTHDKIGLLSTPVITLVSIYVGTPIQYTAALITGFLVATYLFSPDLDLNSRIYRRWGLLRFIWYPYRKLIHHRSWLSHSGPISATLRLLYFSIFLLPIYFWFPNFLLTFTTWYGMIWLSVVLSDTIHLIADFIWRD